MATSKSMTTNLASEGNVRLVSNFMDKVYGSLDCNTNEALPVLYLDLSKAFDEVPHWKLNEKVDK